MSQENVEIVRRLLAAFQSVDVGNFERRIDEVREIFDPEVEWVAAPHSLLASEEYRGYDGAVMRLSERTNELEVDEARSSLLTLRDGRIARIEADLLKAP